MLARTIVAALILFLGQAVVAAADEKNAFISVGIGGGGAMFSPACSPHDPNLMFVACDMGGVYRSQDGGLSWKMLDKRQLRSGKEFPVQFHPSDPRIVFALYGGALRMSHDAGQTFSPAVVDPPWGRARIDAFGIHSRDGATMFVGAQGRVYRSDNGGKSWTESIGTQGRVLRFFSPRGNRWIDTAFAGTSEGVFRTDDGGQTWSDASAGLPSRNLVAFAGGVDENSGDIALYCTLPSKAVDGKLAGGIFRSRDLGMSWQPAMASGLNLDIGRQDQYGFEELPQYQWLGMAENRPGTVYVTTRGTGSQPPHHFTVFRSDDGGDSWKSCFTPGVNVTPGWVPTDLSWGFGGPALAFAVSSSNPDVAMLTNMAETYVTRDGGLRWQGVYSTRLAADGDVRQGEAWTSNGLEVTGPWHIAFDPHDRDRAYICYTDIGFARSEDRGRSWRYSGRGSPWRNTWYDISFDPQRPGTIYAACSNHHDIPHYRELDPGRQQETRRRGGGVCLSRDYGASWQPLGQGLPDAPTTSIVLDLRSNAASRVLYVALFGHGVYKSTDAGTTWHHASEGLGSSENMHAYSVKLHADGTLFCSVTGKRHGVEFTTGSGLYRSDDGGGSWRLISPPLKWAGDFDFDPTDSRTIYLAASTAPRFAQGGLYRTTDGGGSWTQVVKEGDLPRELHPFIQAFFVTIHPRRHNVIYLSAYTHGLFISEDRGDTWREIKGIPFTGVQRVTFDPVEHGVIWVTTHGGGIWKGPELGLQ